MRCTRRLSSSSSAASSASRLARDDWHPARQVAKFELCIGVNDKSLYDVPHDGYSPVLPHITTQQQFKEERVSYYMDMERTHGGTTKEERKAAKRAKLLDKRAKLLEELIYAIPMQQLQRAFESPTSPGELRKLQRKHGFKESNKCLRGELRVARDL